MLSYIDDMSTNLVTRQLPWSDTPFPLGRHVEHDPQSRNFPAPLLASKADVKTIFWGTTAQGLDQGEVGSCTGNATAQLINLAFWRAAREKVKGAGAFLTEADALTIYEAATRRDSFPGRYPPTDTGSTGLAAAKAAVTAGYARKYTHAFGLPHLLSALQAAPVIVGTVWTNGMFKHAKDGQVKPTGAEAGGHEYLCFGADIEKERVWFRQSWGESWGVSIDGIMPSQAFYISFANYAKLLDNQGDVTIPLPVI